MDRFFTLEAANQLLPDVKGTVKEILAKAQEARSLMVLPDAQKHEATLMELDQRLKDLMGRLEAMGCFYKDWNFEIGLVDFPAIINGQEALLCWRSDEPALEWFHGLQDGYAGRRRITPDLIFS